MRNAKYFVGYISLIFCVYFHFLVSAEFQTIEDNGNVSLLSLTIKRHLNWLRDCLLVVLTFSFRFAKNNMSKKHEGGWLWLGMGKMLFHQFLLKYWWDPINNLDQYFKTQFCHLVKWSPVCVFYLFDKIRLPITKN